MSYGLLDFDYVMPRRIRPRGTIFPHHHPPHGPKGFRQSDAMALCAGESTLPPWGISRARILTFVCVPFARIRRLRKSPQYLSVILQGKMSVSANTRNSRLKFHKSCEDTCQNPGSRNVLPLPPASGHA